MTNLVSIFVSLAPDALDADKLSLFSERGVCLEFFLADPKYYATSTAPGFSLLQFQSYPHKTGVHGPIYGIMPVCEDPWIEDYSRRSVQICYEAACSINANHFVMHTGYYPLKHPRHTERWAEEFAAFLAQMLESHPLGPKIAIENDSEPDWDILDRLFKRLAEQGVEDRVCHCLDIGHFVVHQGEDLRTRIFGWAAATDLYHFHDNNLRNDDHMPIGSGLIDYQSIVRWILESSQAVNITLEYHHSDVSEYLMHIDKLVALIDQIREQMSGSAGAADQVSASK